MSNIKSYSNNSNSNKIDEKLMSDNICFGVYVALKMNQLNYDFNLSLLK